MSDLLKIIKRQIDKQTKSFLNTELQQTPVIGISEKKEGTYIRNEPIPFSPEWTYAGYILERSNFAITVEDFLNVSQSIIWQQTGSRQFKTNDVLPWSNILFGMQVLTENAQEFLINIRGNGNLYPYVKKEGNSVWAPLYFSSPTERYIPSQIPGETTGLESFDSEVRIQLDGGSWYAIVFIYYVAVSGGAFSIEPDYDKILQWKPLNMGDSSTPIWQGSGVSSSQVFVNNNVPIVKNTLTWEKDMSVGFAGNNIYRKSNNNSGVTIGNFVPSTLWITYRNTFATPINRWFTTFTSGTLNSSDDISFTSTFGTEYEISQTKTIQENRVPNGHFLNDNSNWTFSSGTISSQNQAQISSKYYELSTLATNTRYSITSTFVPVSKASLYTFGASKTTPFFSNSNYGLSGYGGTPSRWSSSGSILSMLATRSSYVPVLQLDRDKSGGQVDTESGSVYLSTSASYQVSCTASAKYRADYSLSFHLNSGATVYSTSTIFAEKDFTSYGFSFTPSASGSGFLRISIPSSTSTMTAATYWFQEINIVETYTSGLIDFFAEVQYYDTAKAPCATTRGTNVFNSSSFSLVGTNATTALLQFPSTCSFIKLAYVATINAVNTLVNVNYVLHNMIFTTETEFPELAIYATQNTYIRTTSNITTSADPNFVVGASIYLTQLDHIVDRPRESTDGAIVSWDDFNVKSNTLYEYYIDAYDSIRNRSALSAAATVTSSTPVETFRLGYTLKHGSTIIPPADDNWYNQTVTASLYKLTGATIATYYAQYYYLESDTRTAWAEFAGGIVQFDSDYQYSILFKAIDIYGNESDKINLQINIDKVAPTITNRDDYWVSDSQGYPQYNRLHINNQYVHDKYDYDNGYTSTYTRSGHKFTYVKRADIVPLNSNCLFNLGDVDSVPYAWTVSRLYNDTKSTASISSTRSYNGAQCLKFGAHGGGTFAPKITSNSFSANSGDKVYIHARVYPSVATTTTVRMQYETTAGSYYLTSDTTFPSTANTWYYISGSLTHTTATLTQITIFPTGAATQPNGDFILIDEFIAYKNPSFSTIAQLEYDANLYIDSKVQPWNYYVYQTAIEDGVQHKNYSPYKIAQPLQDYRDKYRNILDNSSFERTYFTSGGTLRPVNWGNIQYTGQFATSKHDDFIVQTNGGYDGHNYIVLSDTAESQIWQNDIHILPWTGALKSYIFSYYYAKGNPTNAAGYSYVYGFDKERNSVVLKSEVISATSTTWTRNIATLTVSVPSLTHFGVVFVGDPISGLGGQQLKIDAVQLEEKTGSTPSDYYDNKSITADYLQGNLIRANMIEAEQIYGNHIKANAITATQINADTITTNELNLVDTNIFVVDKQGLQIEAFGAAYATRANIHMCLGTSDTNNAYLSYYTVQTVYDGATASYLEPAFISNTFNASSFGNDATTPTQILKLLNGYPLIGRQYPLNDSANSYGIIISYSGATAYSGFASLSTNYYMFDKAAWTNKQVIATKMQYGVNSTGELKYYNNNFYYGGKNNTTKIKFTKLSPQGTLISWVVKSLFANVQSFDFDISDTGTIFTTFVTTNSATIQCVAYDTSFAVVTPTFKLNTYMGYSDNLGILLPQNLRAEITNVSVSYAERNKYVVAYSLSGNSYAYYRIVTGVGTEIVGLKTDLTLIPQQIYPGYRTGQYQLGGRAIRSYGNNILYYIPSNYSAGKVGYGPYSTDPICGRAVYLTNTSPTIILEDLLNRLS